jgi:hypothetical protein
VIANLIRAALELAEMPLSRSQEVSIQTLGRAWADESERACAALPDGAPVLAHVVAKVDAKLRFLNGVKQVLGRDQREFLFHPEVESRLQLDLLSPGVVYSALRVPADANDREGLERALLETLFSLAGLDEVDLSPFAWVAKRWVDEIPGVLTPRLPWHEDVAFEPIESAQAKARAQLRAIERILGTGRLDDDEVEALRRVDNLLRPRIRCVVPSDPVDEEGD